ncbi:AMSH-like ubiquitin thioesterase 1 isoform X2 [Cornus florida]|uniref:AMSH-like ubiquitin thioesterase 1 isoform X2 n=1 Tax=Cornus florida TaxID=4283 RepID=UPI00289FA8A8|nr:AMSH-like ubiquitin thioesterase 1 isoform X2 [Cornus florida]
MRSSSEGINIAARTQKLDVDNRISLRFYYRIADNVLRQADIFRREKNIIDLYVMLMRFSSLVSETIPCHRDYKASRQSNTNFLMKKLLDALNELEELKPAVQQKLDELNRKHVYQVNGWGHIHQNSSFDSSLELYPIKKQTATSHNITKTPQPAAQKFVHQGLKTQQFLYAKPVEEQFRRLSLSIPLPKEETLSRHSILGPNGLRGQWQPPSSDKGVQYPSNLDLTPVVIPSLQQPVENGVLIRKDSSNSEHERSSLESILPVNDENQTCHVEEDLSLISFETIETPTQIDIIRQPSPPPVLADVQDLIPASSLVTDAANVMENPSPDGLVCSEPPLQLHISTKLMDSFMKMARSNTDKNLETCGVLAGSLKNRKFYVTTLIIPKQESTSDSCQTTNEEEIFEVQDKQSLFPLGWIHTHPTQSCFMSSIDVHTHYSYQIMLPESIAIVMAPRDSSRTHGIFRLTNPGGMTVIRQCPRRGFHPHDPPADGGPIYKQCSDVYMNPDLKFDVVDLR